MNRQLLAVAVLLASTTVAVAQTAPPPREKPVLVTRVYDLKGVIGDRAASPAAADMEKVIQLILDTVPLGELKPGNAGPQLIERENHTLEVRATEKVQGEIKDLLAALEGLADLAVDIRADVIELDPAAAEKLRRAVAAVGKPGSPITAFGTSDEPPPAEQKALPEVNAILKAGKVIQTSTVRFANGREAVVSARRSTLTYYPQQVIGTKPQGPPQIVKEGFALLAQPVVSADRRFVRLKLTEQSATVTGIKRRDLGVIEGDKPLVLTSPAVEDFGKSGTAVVADGGTVLFRLDYAPNGKVWVVVLHPAIFIQAEQDELKKQEKK